MNLIVDCIILPLVTVVELRNLTEDADSIFIIPAFFRVLMRPRSGQIKRSHEADNLFLYIPRVKFLEL